MRTDILNVIRYLTVTSILLLLVMFVTGCNEDAAPTDSINKNQSGVLSINNVIHHVSLGGADVCEALGLPTGCDANFSLVANMKADGSVSGQWQDTFAGGGEGIHVAVDCMNVDGNWAVIGGVITHGTVGGVDVSGWYAITVVVDNGTSSNDPPDQMSFSFFDPGYDCQLVQILNPGDFDLFDLTHGQVKVR
ncbi:MAG: hypothetical protein WBG58_14710 [Ignavibacteriaceae bacterium]